MGTSDEPSESQRVGSPSIHDNQPVESQLAKDQLVENQPIKSQPAENQLVQSQPVDNQPVKIQPAENQPVQSQPADIQPVESQHVENQSADNQSVKCQSVGDVPVVIQPGDHDLNVAIVTYKYSKRSACAQVVATLIENTLLIDIAIEMAIPALVLGALHRHTEEKLCMDDDQASWFGSMSHLFHFTGSLVSGVVQEKFGRKGSMILINIPILAAYLTLYKADSIYALYAVAITLGLCCGLVEAPLHSYIGEIGEPHVRGTLTTLIHTAVGVGFILTFFVGYLVDWRTAALIVSAVPVITFFSMTQIPESPMWLIKRRRLDDAQKSLSWLRGWVTPAEVHQEFQDLVEYVKNSTKQSIVQPQRTESSPAARKDNFLKRMLKEIADRKVLRPLRVVLMAFLISNLISLSLIKPYIIGILNDFGFPISSMLIMVISTSAFSVGTMVNLIFIRRFGKRRLALFTQLVGTACVFLLGLYSFLRAANWSWIALPGFVWVPMVLLVIIDLCNGLSNALLPWQLVCEMFPLRNIYTDVLPTDQIILWSSRGFASGISGAWGYGIAFAMTKSYLYLEAWITFSGIMFVLGGLSILGWLYYYCYLPETEGKSLERIETYFTDNHDRKEKFKIGKVPKQPGASSLEGGAQNNPPGASNPVV